MSPTVRAPSADNIMVCSTRKNHLELNEEVSFPCEGKGRYVVVLLLDYNTVLTLCNVRVYGRVGRWYCSDTLHLGFV